MEDCLYTAPPTPQNTLESPLPSRSGSGLVWFGLVGPGKSFGRAFVRQLQQLVSWDLLNEKKPPSPEYNPPTLCMLNL